MVSGGGDCAPSRAHHGRSAASAPPISAALRRIPRIDPLEVLENGAPLVGGEPAQLVPRGLAELHGGFAAGVGVVRLEFVAGLGRRRLTLAGVLAVVLLQRAAGVEQPAEQLLL